MEGRSVFYSKINEVYTVSVLKSIIFMFPSTQMFILAVQKSDKIHDKAPLSDGSWTRTQHNDQTSAGPRPLNPCSALTIRSLRLLQIEFWQILTFDNQGRMQLWWNIWSQGSCLTFSPIWYEEANMHALRKLLTKHKVELHISWHLTRKSDCMCTNHFICCSENSNLANVTPKLQESC